MVLPIVTICVGLVAPLSLNFGQAVASPAADYWPGHSNVLERLTKPAARYHSSWQGLSTCSRSFSGRWRYQLVRWKTDYGQARYLNGTLTSCNQFYARPGGRTSAGKDLEQVLKLKPEVAASPASLLTPTAPALSIGPGPDCHHEKCIALTFDDGPNAEATPKILAILEQFHSPATFFVIGSHIAGNQGLLLRMRAGNDEIGNHSWSHPDFTKLSRDQVKQQIDLTQTAVQTSGVPPPTVFRPPYGAMNETVRTNIPMPILLWNEDPKDWATTSPVRIETAVESAAQPGGIIDMHDIYDTTAAALPAIINNLQSRQFRFVTVSQLLNLTPSSRGQYFGQ